MHKGTLEDTIASAATPIGEGGIGIVRISGSRALAIADKIFLSKDGAKPSSYETYTVHYGHIIHRRNVVVENNMAPRRRTTNDEIVDEVLLTVMRAPRSYTKEDVVEINCHGGIQAVKNVLDLVIKLDARLAEPGEFTKRAFLNGRLDLVQAEAVLDVIRAKTESSLKAAMGQLDGRLSKDVSDILDKLIDITSHIEAAIDFPDEQLDIINKKDLIGRTKELIDSVKYLIDSFDEGVILREGVLAVICGKPNIGKSSLMNLLLKRDRCLVAPIPGTTRDAVEEMINIKGVPIRLVDTAGIGVIEDALSKMSADKSKSYIERSDIVLLMLDASAEINEEDLAIIRLVEEKRKIVIINKTDLGKIIDKKSIANLFKKDVIIEMSVEKNKNIELLENTLRDTVYSGKFTQGEGSIITNIRHKELIDKAFNNVVSAARLIKEGNHPELIAIDLKEAVFSLGLIIGRSVSDDVLDRIFENFCIGK
jgi:tRNA modification GTPase